MSTSSSAKSCPKCGATLPSEATDGLCPACLMAEAMVPTQTGADAAGAQPLHTPEELAPHFPQLEILECLGRGGMGVVYKARQKSLNRCVALKLLAPERVHDAGFAERFQKEAQALAALNHPHIVTVYDFGQAGGFYFLLMEFVDGVNLRQAMKAGRFTPEQALAIVPPVCEALQYAHEHGIVHRDIKPENLLLDKEGRVKIADFGIAKMVGTEPGLVVRPGAMTDEPQAEGPASLSVGTPHYMAPEQKQHRRTDHRADIYSLGVVLYELLTGELPADTLQPPSHKVQIDVRLDEVVLRALEREPERRYQQASVLKTQVETILTTPPPGGAKVPAEPAGVEARAPSCPPPAIKAVDGAIPTAAAPYYHRAEGFQERWSWDAAFIWCVTFLLAPLPGILAACLVSTLGAKALFFLLLELIPLFNALVSFAVLRRMERLRDNLPADALELAEVLYAAHTAQSPCLAILCADHLELRRVAGEPVTIPLSDIETVTEVRWLSGRRLWWKRGLKIQRRSAPPVLLALAETVFQRWQPLLAGTVQKLAAQPSRAAVTPAPVESPSRIVTRNLILIFNMAFGVVALPIALASPYPWKQFGLICAPIMIVVGFLRLIGKWPFPALFPASVPPPSDAGVTPAAPLAPKFQSRLRVAAMGLLVTGAANALLFLLGCFGLFGAIAAEAVPRQAHFGSVSLVLFLIMSILTIFGAIQMLRRRSYALAITGSVLAILTFSPLLPLGIGFGLMSLLLLCRAEARQAFQPDGTARAVEAAIPPRPTPEAQTPPAGWTGYEYKSKRTLCGLPLLHVVYGTDPKTGTAKHARGIVAIGAVATGWLAFGGRAQGGIAMGGIALGGLAFGGVAVGLFALGGVALALLMAIGGMAFAPIAVDGRPGNMALWDGHYTHGESFHGLTGSQLNAIIIAFWIVFVALMLLSSALTRWAKQQSFRAARTADEPQPEAASEPRFSRTAIVGACWAPLFFIAFVLMFWATANTTGEYHGPAWWQTLLAVILGGLGFTAPFGTTLLGWIAVTQIRRSAGKLYGLGLAVFDGLLFPLLLLDGICAGVLVGLSRIFVELYANFSNVNNPQVSPPFVTRLANLLSEHPEIAWFVAVLLLLVVDFLIIRAVWRAVTKPVSPKVPSLGKTEAAPFQPSLARQAALGSQSLENVAQPPSRFSRTAIVATVWAAFSCVLAAQFIMAKSIPLRALTASPTWWTLHFLNHQLLSLTGFLGATILGWIAVTQIRRSAEKLRGMSLAVFNGLLFPLLALDALLLAADLSGRHQVTGPGLTPGVTMAQLNIPGWQMLLVYGLIGIVDFLIIRAVWRAVTKSSSPKVPSLGKNDVAPFQPLENVAQPPSRFSRTAIVVASALVLGLGLLAIGVVKKNIFRTRGRASRSALPYFRGR